ncbi:MAG TPA: class I SAM-dependent methyltransferase [Acidimicrobiales bacterium]|nr:class I SAM-dependent methyltransferase [Acidimicrobiales bacterium]
MDDTDAILAEQVSYYRARAAEYDEWWDRQGAYDRSEEENAAWIAAVHALEAWVRGHVPVDADVLEIAAGTGNFTRVIAERAARVTAVDASEETLELNRRKLANLGLDTRAEFVTADAFAWTPPRQFDVVFFSFWISHVPASVAPRFWSLVDTALKPGGRVLFADNLRPWDPNAVYAGERSARTLNDGSTWTVVKRYWSPEALASELADMGWSVEVEVFDPLFIAAHGGRSADV